MKIVYGYQQDGAFLIATVRDDMLSDDINDIKEGIDAVPTEGESYVEISRADCQKIAKHMQFGKKGEIRVVDMESSR